MTTYVDNLVTEKLLTVGALDYASTTTTATVNGTLSLTADSATLQYLTGTAMGYSIVLPDAMTLGISRHFILVNTTNQTIAVKDGAGNPLFVLSQNSVGYIYLQLNDTIAGYWVYFQVLASSTASGIINYNLTSSTIFTTSSATDTLITGFALTPQAGTYAVWYNCDAQATQNNSISTQTIYKNGVAITDSLRRSQSVSSNFVFQQTLMTISSFTGSQQVDVRVRVTRGSLSINGRSLVLIRLGP